MPTGRTQVIHDLDITLTLGTLAQNTALKVNAKVDNTREQGAEMEKVRAKMEWRGKTTNEGPIIVGISVDLSATEIAEALVADPQKFEDTGSANEANRKVFPIWKIPFISTGSAVGSGADYAVTELRDVRMPSWHVMEGSFLGWWAFNVGAALTTGSLIHIAAGYVTKWMRD